MVCRLHAVWVPHSRWITELREPKPQFLLLTHTNLSCAWFRPTELFQSCHPVLPESECCMILSLLYFRPNEFFEHESFRNVIRCLKGYTVVFLVGGFCWWECGSAENPQACRNHSILKSVLTDFWIVWSSECLFQITTLLDIWCRSYYTQ
jgi:hypothetical protein